MANDDLSAILNKLDNLESYVIKIDSSITGDPKRGVIGITQHIETIHLNYREHSKDDDARFEKLDKITEKSNDEISGFKRWLAGASFVILVGAAAIQLIIKAIK